MSLGSSIGGVVGGLINNGRKLPTVDLSALFATINKAGKDKETLINQLPENLKPLYEQYNSSLGTAGADLESRNTKIGQDLLTETKGLYDPNSPVVQATLAALKQQDYSTLPGTLTNLKAQLAATGGLSRGGAGKALTQAVLAPAAQYSQQAATVQAQQLQQQQQATQTALNKVAALSEETAQQLFGMSKEQATQILQYGRSDLQKQLSDLINNIDTMTNQTLGVEGIAAQNAYQNAVTRNSQQEAVTNALANGLGSAVDEALPSGSTVMGRVGQLFGGAAPQEDQAFPSEGIDTSSAGYYQNALANKPQGGGGGGGAGPGILAALMA